MTVDRTGRLVQDKPCTDVRYRPARRGRQMAIFHGIVVGVIVVYVFPC
jgi:hypothetical protein